MKLTTYDAYLETTGVARETSSEKIYRKLGLESVKFRIWLRKLCLFYKIFIEKCVSYLFDMIPTMIRVHNTKH